MPTRIEELASNGTMYYRGDECLEIAPFDNYYMFTIYKESPDVNKVDESVPLDLTHIGLIYLLFLDGENEIRIPNYTDATDVDMVNGQVVFKISKDDAKRILATTGGVFYITSQMTDGRTAGDETVLYTGRWVDFATGMAAALTDTVNSLNATVVELRAKLESTIAEKDATIAMKDSELENLRKTVEANEKMIETLQKTIEAYNSDVVDYITANIVSERNLTRDAVKRTQERASSADQRWTQTQSTTSEMERNADKNTLLYL